MLGHALISAPACRLRARRVPTSAVEELPPFQAGAAPQALQRLEQQLQQDQRALPGLAPGLHGSQQQRQLFAYVPAKPPPSRAATDAWLAARRSRRRGAQARSSSGAELAMDPNTGALLPAAGGGGGGGAAEAARLGPGGVQRDSQGGSPGGLLGDADLLASPSLCSLGSDGGGSQAGTPGSLVAATPSTAAGTARRAAVPGTQAGRQSRFARGPGSRGSGSSSSEGEEGEEDGTEGQVRSGWYADQPLPRSLCISHPTCPHSPAPRALSLPTRPQVRPPSPKYDEGFFTNPFPALTALTQRAPASRRKHAPGVAAAAVAATPASHVAAGSSHQQLRPSRLGGAAGAADQASSLAGSGGSTPGSQPDQQPPQQPQQQQRPPPSLLKSVLKSALKGQQPGRGSQEDEQQRASQASQGSDSTDRRVSFAAGGSSQDATPAQAQAPPQQQLQQGTVPPSAATLAAPGPAQLTGMETQRQRAAGFISQITPPSPGLGGSGGATPLSQAGFKQRRCVAGKGQQLTLLSLELHAECRCAWGRCLVGRAGR